MWGEQLFCVSVLTVILGIGVSWHFILMPLMLWDIAQFLLIWNFCAVPILEIFSSCSLPPLSSLMLTNLSSLTSLAAYSVLDQQEWWPAHSWLLLWLQVCVIQIWFWWCFWFISWALSVLPNPSLNYKVLWKVLLGFITRIQGSNTATCFTVCA